MKQEEIRKIADSICCEYDIFPYKGSAVLALYMPYSPLVAEDRSIAFIDSYYPAYQRLYEKKKIAKERFSSLGIEVLEIKEGHQRVLTDAGLAVKLKSGLVWKKKYGTYFSFELLRLCGCRCDIPIYKEEEKALCGGCDICRSVCRGGAITDNGFVPEKCVRALQNSPLPEPRAAGEYKNIGNLMLGCTECQYNCPMNRAAVVNSIVPDHEYEKHFSLKTLLYSCIEKGESWDHLIEYIGKNYERPRRILSYVLNAIENSGDAKSYVEDVKYLYNKAQNSDIKDMLWQFCQRNCE